MKKWTALLLALTVLLGAAASAQAELELTYEGTVVAAKSVPLTATFGGRVSGLRLRKGDLVTEGDVIAELTTTKVFAPQEGTVTGVYATAGDFAEAVAERYGAIVYIEPVNRYAIAANSEKAFNASENRYIHLGETVYLSCTTDGTHQGTGIVSALTEDGYSIEVTGGDFSMKEKVGIFRDPAYKKESRIGTGTVDRVKPIAVKGTGSILKMPVKQGDFVERGEILFETVDGTLDGYYAPDSRIICPVTGIVAAVDAAEGASVNKGDSLIHIYPSDAVQVEFQIPEADLFSLAEGQRVEIELYWDNGEAKPYEGTIASVSHMSEETTGDNAKKMYKVYVNFEPDARIRLGMTVMIRQAEPVSEAAEAPAAEETEAEKDAEL